MVKNSDIVNKELKDFINLLKDSYNLFAVVLFGSYADGRQSEYSDIDIAVFSEDFGDNPLEDMQKLFKLRRSIDPDIEPLPFKKDVYFQHDKTDFVNDIIIKGKIIYKDGQILI